jgi:hypothetical protein
MIQNVYCHCSTFYTKYVPIRVATCSSGSVPTGHIVELTIHTHTHQPFVQWKIRSIKSKKVKVSRYTPWRRMGGEEVLLLLILNLGH